MKSKEAIADGQISIFDLQFIEKPIKVTKTEEKVIENKKSFIEKVFKVTEKQKQIIDKFKNQSYVTKIILHSKGSITIETKESELFTAHYINAEGKEELSYSNKSPVLPWEKIIYCSSEIEKVPLTEIQENKVQKLINERKDIKRIIRRKGDVNIIAELPEGLISITPIGWELPYISVNNVDCSEDEIYLIPYREVREEVQEDAGKVAKVGDYVQAMNGKKLIEGKLFSEYNAGDTFNIIFENGTKHTAIPRLAIKKILKSA